MLGTHRRRRSVTWMVVIAFTALALLTTGCAPPAPGLRVGIAYGDRLVWMSDRDLGAALDDAVAVGARWVRADLMWTHVQPDGPDTYRWERFDRVVTAAEERGLDLLPVLGFTPAWARPVDCTSKQCRPADPMEFAAFAGAAAKRYAPRGVHTWEVWNEPNLTRSWAPAPDEGAYTALLTETSQALRDNDPEAYVILGGLAATTTTKDGNISQTAFLQGVSARGGNHVVDAIGYHPYTYPFLASSVTSWGTPWERIEGTPDSLRSVLVANGTPKMPVWLTEFGAPTNGPGSSSDGRGAVAEDTTHVPEERQAQIATDAVRTAAATPHVAALIWYAERDLGTDRRDSENFFGLRRADGSAKPALAALRDAVTGLSGR